MCAIRERTMSNAPNDRLPVIVLGAGGTGWYMADCIDKTVNYRFAGFLDDDASKKANGYEGLPVLGGLDEWRTAGEGCLFVSALYGVKKMRSFCSRVESLGIPSERWATIVDSRSTVCSSVSLGKGTFVAPGCVIEPGCSLGARCALLGNVYVAHHTVLENDVVCANSVSIAGGVRVGACTYLGANASVRQHISIGKHVIVGMGAVVINTVEDDVSVVGNPARELICTR